MTTAGLICHMCGLPPLRTQSCPRCGLDPASQVVLASGVRHAAVIQLIRETPAPS